MCPRRRRRTRPRGTSSSPTPRVPDSGIGSTGCPKAAGRRPAAAFDTRIGAKLAGGAAPGIARRLRSHGYQVITEPEGFFVQDNGEGPVKDGESDRARAWASCLIRQAAVPASG